ncbi:MAG: RNA 3'-terminal phosphate cyclase, partial [Candidatus Altiarchaeota archaeon]|nr:RNA 3'-terminal phosphate cyclase [Candidatus Altiarchaeota archaeon]
MLIIDGSYGEGGGQILRTAVSMSVLTGEAVEVTNIRSNRPEPGLKRQHLTCVQAAADLCSASVSGLEVGSRTVSFTPSAMKPGGYSFDVGTAGSVTLVFQTLLLPALCSNMPLELSVAGGTDVPWSPPADYLRHVLIPMLEKTGYKLDARLLRRGYYPKGGGRMEVSARPSDAHGPIGLLERGRVLGVHGLSHASSSLRERNVAERQGKAARKALFDRLSGLKIDCAPDIDVEYCDTLSLGSGVMLWAVCENSVIGAGSIGSRNRKAEDVG